MGVRKERTGKLFMSQDNVLANVAILYYKENLTQKEIATRLGLSRPTVVNYLRLARDQNIVDIRIDGAPFSSSSLAKELRDKFRLTDAYVAHFAPDETLKPGDGTGPLNRHIAHVGAMALHDILQPGDRVGIAWGETLQLLADQAPYRTIESLTICQMVGSMTSPLVFTAESCAISLAFRLGANCYTLHTPAVLASPELAKSLCEEPVISDQLKRLSSLDRTIFSVGNCDSNTPIVQSALTTEAEFNWYRSRGAVGVLCGRFIDALGNHIHGPIDDRMIGIGLDQLRQNATGILVAGGLSKLAAIAATLAAGYVSHLVTDDRTARALMDVEEGV